MKELFSGRLPPITGKHKVVEVWNDCIIIKEGDNMKVIITQYRWWQYLYTFAAVGWCAFLLALSVIGATIYLYATCPFSKRSREAIREMRAREKRQKEYTKFIMGVLDNDVIT